MERVENLLPEAELTPKSAYQMVTTVGYTSSTRCARVLLGLGSIRFESNEKGSTDLCSKLTLTFASLNKKRSYFKIDFACIDTQDFAMTISMTTSFEKQNLRNSTSVIFALLV